MPSLPSTEFIDLGEGLDFEMVGFEKFRLAKNFPQTEYSVQNAPSTLTFEVFRNGMKVTFAIFSATQSKKHIACASSSTSASPRKSPETPPPFPTCASGRTSTNVRYARTRVS
eukprot:770343_1